MPGDKIYSRPPCPLGSLKSGTFMRPPCSYKWALGRRLLFVQLGCRLSSASVTARGAFALRGGFCGAGSAYVERFTLDLARILSQHWRA